MHFRRQLILLFSANTLSNFASGITILAIPWYLVNLPEEENGAFMATAMMVIITFVTLFWGLYAGTLIDKYNRKRIFQILQSVDAVAIGFAGFYGYMTGETPFAILTLVAGVTILSWTLFYPNLYAFCQELVRPELYKKINSAIELQGQATNFIGMLIGPVLIAGQLEADWGFMEFSIGFGKWELWEIFLLDAGTYVLSISIISLIRYTPGDYFRKSTGSVFSRLKAGFDYLRKDRPLLLFGIASFTIFFTLLVFIQVGMAIYIHGHLGFDFIRGAPIIAGFEMLYSLGALVTGIIGVALARAMQNTNLIRQVTVLLGLAGAVFFSFSVSHSVSLFLLGGFLIGIANSGTRILRITYLVRIVPNTMIGRANTFFGTVNVLCRLIMFFVLLLPFFSRSGNEGHIIYGTLIMSLVCLISGILLLIFFRRFDQKPAYG